MLSQRVRIKENENCIDIHLDIQREKPFLFSKQAIRIDKEYFQVIYINKLLQEEFKWKTKRNQSSSKVLFEFNIIDMKNGLLQFKKMKLTFWFIDIFLIISFNLDLFLILRSKLYSIYFSNKGPVIHMII